MTWLISRRFPVRIALAPLVILLSVCVLWSGGEAMESSSFHVNIGFSGRAFVNVPQQDIKIAVQLLSRKVAKKTVGSADSKIYDSVAEIEQDLKAKMLDAIALPPDDFLELSNRIPLEPVMITNTTQGHEVELLLLTRKDSAIRSFQHLRNRRIAVPAKVNQYGNMYFTWLDTLIMRQGFHGGNRFFTAVAETKKPSQALMQVFFRQTDACITTAQLFDLSAELNPQLGKELIVIERLPKLAGGIIALRRDLPDIRKRILRQAMLTLHEDQEGKQLFVLFQLKNLIPYRPEYLKPTEAFYDEHRRLERRNHPKR